MREFWKRITERFRKQQPGETPETAIVIDRVKSHSAGVAREYMLLEEMFGLRGVHWKLLMQALIHHGERELDHMRIQLQNGEQRNVYFDVTGLFDLPDELPEERERRERRERGAANMKRMMEAYQRGGSEGFDAEFDTLFPNDEEKRAD